MERAIKLSIDNVNNTIGGPFGAVIMRNNIVISEGINLVTKEMDPTAHAEIIAIRLACKKLETIDLSECILYSSCEPCSMCYSAIRWARINKIYYANTRYDAEKIGFSDKAIYDEIINKEMKITHIQDDTAIIAFNLWNNNNNKISY